MRSLYPQLPRSRTVATLLLSLSLIVLPCARFTTHVHAQIQAKTASAVHLASATAGARGVLLQWSSSDTNNLGFNIYRTQWGHRTLVNSDIIGGTVFRGVKHVDPHPDFAFSWLDRSGTADSIYEIESVSMSGESRLVKGIAAVRDNSSAGKFVADTNVEAGQFIPSAEQSYPEGSTFSSSTGTIQDQWAVVAQPAIKILIKADGWYRVTHDQMAAAGFDPTVDIRALQLYGDGREVAIRTNKNVDRFTSGDYIEFYGRGLDTNTADTRVYYLIAGTSAGKRITGDLNADGTPDGPPLAIPRPLRVIPILSQPVNLGWIVDSVGYFDQPTPASEPVVDLRLRKATSAVVEGVPSIDSVLPVSRPDGPEEKTSEAENIEAPAVAVTETPTRNDEIKLATATSKTPAATSGKVKKRTAQRSNTSYAHAMVVASTVPSFDQTILFKERYKNDSTGFSPIFYFTLINGETENYFGRVISSSLTQTLNAPNPETSADGPARLEIALQGVLNQFASNHQVNVDLNGTQVGSFSFGPLDHFVRTINIPVSLLANGANTVKFTKVSSGEICLVDYVKLTYPHALRADGNSLRFSLVSSQRATVDGFPNSNVRLIDYTDPYSVKMTRPAVAPSSLGYSIQVQPSTARTKSRRLLYAIPETQFDSPAGLSLNQPSSLNDPGNGADLVIIAPKALIPSTAPLVALRQSQGMVVSVVDIDDVYDEFSYGVHGPQAVRDFLSHAQSTWSRAPKYVIFLGDADQDPRNYEAVGQFDLVPTKLVDATYNETASDDWLTDFDNDGIADIPMGRIPVRTPAEADIVISKIVNFSPSNAPQTALLVADDPTNYYFNFETANDEVQRLLPSDMTVVRVNKRTDPNAHTNIVNNLNQGLALLNYSGHGNVNTWTGSNIFMTPDAFGSTNGNKLPLVLVMNCLNGYYQEPRLEGIAEGFVKAQNGGAIGVFASSGETIPDGQHDMSNLLYQLLYGSQSIALGDAIKTAKAATTDIDVRRTWIFFGDPSMKLR